MKSILRKYILPLFLICICAINSFAQEWQSMGPDDKNTATFSTGYTPIIKFAPNGIPYLAYRGDGGKATVRRFVNNQWEYVGAPGFSAGVINTNGVGFDFDSTGKPYMIFVDNSTYKATVMKFDGTNWVTIGGENFSGTTTLSVCIKLDKNDVPYIAYTDQTNLNKALVKRLNSASVWESVGGATATTNAAYQLSLAIDDNNVPYLSYSDQLSSLKATVIKLNGSSWQTVGSAGFSAGQAISNSLVFAKDGTLYNAFQDGGNDKKLKVMKFNGSGWQAVGAAGISAGQADHVSLNIDKNNVPYVTYKDLLNNKIAVVMKWNGSSWQSLGAGQISRTIADNPSIAFDPDGVPFLAFQQNTTNAIVKKFVNSTWESVGGVPISPSNINYPSVAMDPQGTPYLVYSDFGNGSKATVKKFVNDSWQTVGIEGFTSTSAGHTAITFDNSGTPYIVYQAYSETITNKAAVAKFNGTSWQNVGPIGFSASGVQYTSIAIDQGGVIYVAFQDESTGWKVTVMKFNGSSWQNVGTPGFSVGQPSSVKIAIAPGGTPYVVYPDGGISSGKLVVKKFTGSSWQSVGPEGISPGAAMFGSIIMDNQGTPVVAFRDNANGSKASVMKFNGSSWAYVGPAAASEGQTHYTSLALDKTGALYLSYLDWNVSAKTTVKKFNGTSWDLVGSAGFTAGQAESPSMAISDKIIAVAYSFYGAYAKSFKLGPSAPANFAAVAGDAKVDLSWNAVGDAASYKLYKGTSNSNLVYLTSFPSGTTTYTDNSADNGTTYYYGVTTVDVNGNESGKAEANAKPLAAPTITTVTDLSVNIPEGTYTLTPPLSNSAGAFTYTSSNSAVATINGSTVNLLSVGETTITATQVAAGAYSSGSTTFKLTVTDLPNPDFGPFTVADNVVYGDGPLTLTAPSSTGSGAFTFSSSNPAIASVSGTTLTVLKAGTVIITATQASDGVKAAKSAPASLVIAPKTLTASTEIITKVYDGTAPATVTFKNFDAAAGLVGSDDVKAVYTSAAYADANVAPVKNVTLNGLTLTGAAHGNYILAPLTLNGSITVRPITVTAQPVKKQYDGLLAATISFDPFTPANGLIGNDAVQVNYQSAEYDDVNKGTGKTVSISGLTLAGAAKDNYSLEPFSISGEITAKPITVTAMAGNKIYGKADPELAYTSTALIAGDNFSGALSRIAGEISGNYPINQGTLALSTNYTLTYQGANFTINRAPLTVTADHKEKILGTANPVLTASYTGFVNGDDESLISGSVGLSTTATLNSILGIYPIVVNGPSSSANYTISYVDGTLEVKPGAPSNILLSASGSTILENQPAGILAGTLSSTSEDPNATFTYSLPVGDQDNSLFSISGNQLKTAAPLNYEQKSSYTVNVRSTTQYGFSLDKTFTINIGDVNEAPTVNTIADQSVCSSAGEQTIALNNITSGPESSQAVNIYVNTNRPDLFNKLSISKSSGSNGVLSYEPLSGASGEATMTVTVKDNGGTSNGGTDTYITSFTIKVNALPVGSVSSDLGLSIIKGQTAKLTASGGTSYSWVSANGIVSGQNSATLSVRPNQATTYVVTITNASGCSVEQQITITPRPDISAVVVTNIMTPNGDGVNDNFTISNVDMYPNGLLKIYDQIGRVIYTQSNYNNTWNGQVNGQPLATGSYLYTVSFAGTGLPALRGYVNIVN